VRAGVPSRCVEVRPRPTRNCSVVHDDVKKEIIDID